MSMQVRGYTAWGCVIMQRHRDHGLQRVCGIIASIVEVDGIVSQTQQQALQLDAALLAAARHSLRVYCQHRICIGG